MSLRSRMRHVEHRAGVGRAVTIPIILDGRNHDRWRERAEKAHRRGWKIKLIRIGVQHQADTVEEAEAIVAEHREKRERMPVWVYKRGTQGEKVLAKWAPELPLWLRGDDGEA